MVFHTVNEESRKLVFFFNLPPFGDCLIYLSRMIDTLDDQNPCYYKHINQIGKKTIYCVVFMLNITYLQNISYTLLAYLTLEVIFIRILKTLYKTLTIRNENKRKRLIKKIIIKRHVQGKQRIFNCEFIMWSNLREC